MFATIDLFVLEDFARKLSKKASERLRRLVHNGVTESLLYSTLRDAILSPPDNMNEYLSNTLGFSRDSLAALKAAFDELQGTERLRKPVAGKIDKSFQSLVDEQNTDELLAVPVAEEPMEGLEETRQSEEMKTVETTGGRSNGRRIVVKSPLKKISKDKGVGTVKKENFRSKYIRGMKKAIRCICNQKQLKKGICPIKPCDNIRKLAKLRDIIECDSRIWKEISSPKAADTKSFNDSYCFGFFSEAIVRRFHYRFCDLVYERTAEELCANMQIKCCLCRTHSEECALWWRKVQEYARFGMLQELGYDRGMMEEEYGRT